MGVWRQIQPAAAEIDANAQPSRDAQRGHVIVEARAYPGDPRHQQTRLLEEIQRAIELGAQCDEVAAGEAGAHAEVDVAALPPDTGEAEVGAFDVALEHVQTDVLAGTRRKEGRRVPALCSERR